MKSTYSICCIIFASIISVHSNAAENDLTNPSSTQLLQRDDTAVKNVLILGANGQTSAEIIPRLIRQENIRLRLFLRQSERLNKLKSERVELFEGDATRKDDLERAVKGQDIVISTLGGMDLDVKTENLVQAMEKEKVNRIIAISAGGIWNELPEPFNTWDKAMVGSYRPVNKRTAEIVEESELDYTILRPVWLNNKPIEKYTLTYKGERYKGKSTSRASLAQLISEIVQDPQILSRKDVGVSQDGSE